MTGYTRWCSFKYSPSCWSEYPKWKTHSRQEILPKMKFAVQFSRNRAKTQYHINIWAKVCSDLELGDLGCQSRIRTQLQNWTTVLYRSVQMETSLNASPWLAAANWRILESRLLMEFLQIWSCKIKRVFGHPGSFCFFSNRVQSDFQYNLWRSQNQLELFF